MADPAWPVIIVDRAAISAAVKRADQFYDSVKMELEDGGGGIEAVRAAYESALAAGTCSSPDEEIRMYACWRSLEREAGDVDGQRRVFERWMRRFPQGGSGFLPSKRGWECYIRFEVENGEPERVRAVGEALLVAFPLDPVAYLPYIRGLAALSRHKAAFVLAKRGLDRMNAAYGPGGGDRIALFMRKYCRSLRKKRSTAWGEL